MATKGTALIDDFTLEALKDSDVRTMQQRVTIKLDEEIEAPFQRNGLAVKQSPSFFPFCPSPPFSPCSPFFPFSPLSRSAPYFSIGHFTFRLPLVRQLRRLWRLSDLTLMCDSTAALRWRQSIAEHSSRP